MLRTTRADFADNAARMDDPRCVAQQLPIGSGAVASLCTSLIQARAKQAGRRWTRTGAQAVATLRARRASGDGAPFWASHPLQERLRLGPPARPRPRAPQPPPALHAALPRRIPGAVRPSDAPAVRDALTIVGRTPYACAAWRRLVD